MLKGIWAWLNEDNDRIEQELHDGVDVDQLDRCYSPKVRKAIQAEFTEPDRPSMNQIRLREREKR